MDKHLCNGWKSDHDLQMFSEGFPNSYYLALFTKLTAKDGSNVGVSISIVDKKYQQEFISIKPILDGSIFEFIETKSYIVRINYCVRNCMFKDCNDCENKYVELMPTLLKEIKNYFMTNYKKL